MAPKADAAADMRRLWRLVALVVWTLLWFPVVWSSYHLHIEPLRVRAVRVYYLMVAWIFGLHVQEQGRMVATRPLLVVSNHVSYLDILVMGSRVHVSFTPKLEISRWPVIGYFCKLAGCVFIDRRPRAVDSHRAALVASLKKGVRLVLYPEGTTGRGDGLLPFKAGLFRLVDWLAEDAQMPLTLQTAAVAYTALDGKPLRDEQREQVAWVGEAEFAPHLWALLRHRRIDATLSWGAAHLPPPGADRKELANLCREDVARTLGYALEQA